MKLVQLVPFHQRWTTFPSDVRANTSGPGEAPLPDGLTMAEGSPATWSPGERTENVPQLVPYAAWWSCPSWPVAKTSRCPSAQRTGTGREARSPPSDANACHPFVKPAPELDQVCQAAPFESVAKISACPSFHRMAAAPVTKSTPPRLAHGAHPGSVPCA